MISQSNIKYECRNTYSIQIDGRTENITEYEAVTSDMSGVTVTYNYDNSAMNRPYFALRGFGLYGVAPYNQVIAMARHIKGGVRGMPVRKQFVAVEPVHPAFGSVLTRARNPNRRRTSTRWLGYTTAVLPDICFGHSTGRPTLPVLAIW